MPLQTNGYYFYNQIDIANTNIIGNLNLLPFGIIPPIIVKGMLFLTSSTEGMVFLDGDQMLFLGS